MLLFRLLLSLPTSIAKAIIIYLPGESGILLRRWYYGRRLRRCGKGLIVLPGVHIDDPACIEIGNDVMIRENAVIRTIVPRDDDPRDCRWVGQKGRSREPGIIKIGDHARIAFNAFLLGYGGIRIGEKCGIGPGSIILSETYHHKGSVPGRVYKYSQGANPEELCVLRGFVELKDGAGIASAVTVLPGASIGRDSWVGPHSVVRLGANIADGVIAKGDPAKVVLQRVFDHDALE